MSARPLIILQKSRFNTFPILIMIVLKPGQCPTMLASCSEGKGCNFVGADQMLILTQGRAFLKLLPHPLISAFSPSPTIFYFPMLCSFMFVFICVQLRLAMHCSILTQHCYNYFQAAGTPQPRAGSTGLADGDQQLTQRAGREKGRIILVALE